MNSKILFACVFVVNICIITAITPVNRFGVFVKTADKEFESHKGTMKISIITSNGTQKEIAMTQNDVEIRRGISYYGVVDTPSLFKDITSVHFRWTPASPYNETNEPEIYFESVILSIFPIIPYLNMNSVMKLKFCPETIPIGIKPYDGTTFNLCNM